MYPFSSINRSVSEIRLELTLTYCLNPLLILIPLKLNFFLNKWTFKWQRIDLISSKESFLLTKENYTETICSIFKNRNRRSKSKRDR